MKKHCIFLILLTAALMFTTSCSKDDDNHLERWMIENQNALNAIKANPDYKELKSPGNEGSIYYRVINKGEGKDSIYYTSTVRCYYKGWLVADYPEFNNTKKGYIFSRYMFDDGPPHTTNVGIDVVRGLKTAMQHMVAGDKWEIWIPYQLGFGRDGNFDTSAKKQTIPGYSTLAYELEIVDVKGIDDI